MSDIKETAVCVRSAAREDLKAVARIHKDRFDDDVYLLGQYSVSLIAAFYRRYLSGTVFLVHANVQGEVDAFVLGGEAGMLRERKRDFARACACNSPGSRFCGLGSGNSPSAMPGGC